MEYFQEILKIILPSILMVIMAWLLLKTFFENQNKQIKNDTKLRVDELKMQLKQEDKKLITPIRLQAYERIILLLERISPQSLIFRVNRPGQNVVMLQSALLQGIRDEYEHNQSQQLYIGTDVWEMVKQAKEETITLINEASSKVKPDAVSAELSQKIFEEMARRKQMPTEKAILALKKDIQRLF